jgi:predicted nucleotidyltransferase
MRFDVAGQPARLIYRCIIGSRAYGLATDDSDLDRRGI